MPPPMEQNATQAPSLYEADFAEWSDRMAELLHAGRFAEIDIENVAEEIADLGKAARKAVRSQLQRLMMHKLKQQLQPERDGASWAVSIAEARDELQEEIEESPSLSNYLRENMQRVYTSAVTKAMRETRKPSGGLPAVCPWTLEELLQQQD